MTAVHELLRALVGDGPEPDPDSGEEETFKQTQIYENGHWEVYKRLLSYRRQVWDEVNKVPYPSNERLTFNNLPYDIYVAIVGYVVGGCRGDCDDAPECHHPDDLANVKAMRLTNHGLYVAASPYLASRIDVEMTEASLARLEEITLHPHIGPWIRQIRFRLPLYHATLARDTSMFAEHATGLLLRDKPKTTLMVDEATDRWWAETTSKWPFITMESTPEERRRCQMTNDSMRIVADDGRRLMTTDQLLHAAFLAYRDGFFEQLSLRKENSFCLRAAELAKRLPRLQRLVIVDWSSDHDKLYPENGLPDNNCPGLTLPGTEKKHLSLHDIFRLISSPMKWGVGQHLGRPYGDNARTMRDLLIALGDRGVKPRDLSIDVSAPWRFSDLHCASRAESSLVNLTEMLENFQFDVTCTPTLESDPHWEAWPQRELSDLEGLRTFTDSLLQGQNLKRIRLRPQALTIEQLRKTELVHLNMLVTPREWPELRRLSLQEVPIHSSKLGLFLGQRKAELSLDFDTGRVIYGSWREALDVMRDAVSTGGLRVVALRDCQGAEYDALGQYEIGKDIRDACFGSLVVTGEGWSDGHALCYVMGREETYQDESVNPWYYDTAMEVNPFDMDKLSGELGQPFVFEPRF